MNRTGPSPAAALRILGVGALILALLHLSAGASSLIWMARPALAAVLALFGGYVSEGGTHLVIGVLRIDWAREYAGFEVLVLIWCLVLWNSIHDRSALRFALRMLSAIPAAVVINILRVFLMTAWRQTFFPSVESTPMHLFLGFIWLLPLLAFYSPPGRRGFLAWSAENFQLGAALCMIAPLITTPGGSLAATAALTLLAGQQWRNPRSTSGRIAILLWLASAFLLAGSSIPSLWLPWLLLCPWCTPKRWLLSPAVLLFPATVPDFSDKYPWLAAIGIAGAAWRYFRPHSSQSSPAGPVQAPMALGWATGIGLLLLLILPFTASTLGPVLRPQSLPPAGMMAQPVEQGTFLIRLINQDSSIRLTWHAAGGDGRHASFPPSVHQQPGSILTAVENEPALRGDPASWVTEAFLTPDGRLLDYENYLKLTNTPFAAAGVHLMASAPRGSLSACEFHKLSQELFARVGRLAVASPAKSKKVL